MADEKRKYFLINFLSILSAYDIRWGSSDENMISGTVIYSDIEEYDKTESGFAEQDFCWRIKESAVPSQDVLKIIQTIKENNLIDIDKITVPAEELFLKIVNIDLTSFKSALNELMEVKVKMIDKGEETDSFFIHF